MEDKKRQVPAEDGVILPPAAGDFVAKVKQIWPGAELIGIRKINSEILDQPDNGEDEA